MITEEKPLSAAVARQRVREALRELAEAVGPVDGLASPEDRLNAAFTIVKALFPKV